MSVFHDWTLRETAAVHRATAKLRAAQPKPEDDAEVELIELAGTEREPCERNCYWHSTKRAYVVTIRVEGVVVICGTLKKWEADKAHKMQTKAERAYYASIYNG